MISVVQSNSNSYIRGAVHTSHFKQVKHKLYFKPKQIFLLYKKVYLQIVLNIFSPKKTYMPIIAKGNTPPLPNLGA